MRTRSIHKENSKAWWDEKYTLTSGALLYGKEPSKFLMESAELFPKAAAILDVACGEGRNAVALASKGHRVTALDFSSVALERAKVLAVESHLEVTFKAADLDMYIPELMSFGVISIVNYKPATTFLTNVARGLAKDGFLIVEAHLVEACKTDESLETFECFSPNELLRQFVTPQGSFRVLSYSEIASEGKAFLVAKKTQLF
jgi:SAM-dependent methyltransferase